MFWADTLRVHRQDQKQLADAISPFVISPCFLLTREDIGGQGAGFVLFFA